MSATNKLTPLAVSRKREPGRYADGGGLYLQVSPAKTKSWVFRFMLTGRAREMGLAARNAEFGAAAALHGEVSPAHSKELAELLKHYRSSAWLRERALDSCPPNRIGRIEGHFWRALKAWPRTVGGEYMHKIVVAQLEVKSAFHFQECDRSSPDQVALVEERAAVTHDLAVSRVLATRSPRRSEQ